MEKTPLLNDNAQYQATEDSNHSVRGNRPLIPSKSYDQLPTSITSYFGEHYQCVIPPPRGPPSHNSCNNSETSESTDLQIILETPKRHKPLFICLVTFIDIVILIYSCVVGKVESIGFLSYYESKQAQRFGDIHKSRIDQTNETFGLYPGKNIFIGPNASFLVTLGALYSPCMREDKGIKNRIQSQKDLEKKFTCCSLNGECAMMDTKSCYDVSGKSVGRVAECSLSNVDCNNGITLRPCCLGVHAKCCIVSEEKCLKLKGKWLQNKLLCGDVNCLDSICGMTGTHQTYGNQFYRLITPIFLHIGILHLLTNLVFQIVVGYKIEMEIGTILTSVIYMVSGLGGNLFSGIFTPLIPQVGASGALFGLMGLILVYYVHNYNRLQRPRVDLCGIIAVILVSFALGTIPYIGNFVHLGGFSFGLLTTVVVLKQFTNDREPRAAEQGRPRRYMWRIICFGLLVLLIVSSFAIFYTYEDDFCPNCKYIDCIPYTKTFCPDMSSDGILNADSESS